MKLVLLIYNTHDSLSPTNQVSYVHCINKAWRPNIPLEGVVKAFAEDAQQWNKNVFGNIFHKKKRSESRIAVAKKALAIRPNPFLVALEKDFHKEYAEVLNIGSEFWAMKARIS